MGSSTGTELRTAGCTKLGRPLVIASQVICFGPAHFLMACFHRLLVVATASNQANAAVRVTERSDMVDAYFLAAGVPADRLVTGCVTSRRVIVPEGTFFGNPSAGSLRLMRRWARGVAQAWGRPNSALRDVAATPCSGNCRQRLEVDLSHGLPSLAAGCRRA